MENNHYQHNLEELLKKSFLAQDFEAEKNANLLMAVSSSTLQSKGAMFWLTNIKPYFLNGWVLLVMLIGGAFVVGSQFLEAVAYSPNNYSYQLPVDEAETIDKLELKDFAFPKKEVIKQTVQSKTALTYKVPEQKNSKSIKVLSPEKEYSEFPKLSDEQLKEHFKQKKSFVKYLMKSAGQSMLIPANNLEEYANNSYYLKQTEVTNAQYRLFLNDLIVQGKRKEYSQAKIDTNGWTNAYDYEYLKPLDDKYHWHPAYNEYPVVNITVKGAQLYCLWMTEEIQKLEKNKLNIESARLPTVAEWKNAASVGGKMSPYPWGGPYVRNDEGNYLANFKPLKNNFSADGAMTTIKVYAYNPNEYGLFNLSGNVAEMVTNNNTGKVGLKGGSWFDPMKYIQIDAPLRLEDSVISHPTVGFRPVVIIKKEEESTEKADLDQIKPSLTAEQKQENFKRKKEMLKQVIKFNHDYYTLTKQGTMKTPNGTEFTIGPVMYKKHEVSNIEYKTFLFDLIIQKRYDEFFVAKPNEKLWRSETGLNEPFVQYYFSHPAYDNYPILNISTKGAELFCTWLYTEVKKEDAKNKTQNIVNIRLPKYEEWLFAAGYQGHYKEFPWEEKSFKSQRRKSKGQILANFKRNKEDNIGVAGKLNDNAEITAPVQSYWPNPYGMYNPAGNAAEIVKYKDGEYGTKGGSWQSSEEEIKIYAPDTTKGNVKASPTVGFRYVLEFLPPSEDIEKLIGEERSAE